MCVYNNNHGHVITQHVYIRIGRTLRVLLVVLLAQAVSIGPMIYIYIYIYNDNRFYYDRINIL